MNCVDLRAGEVERPLRAGHVRHHRSRVARERHEQLILQDLRTGSHRRQQAERQHGWIASLQRPHVRAHRVEALDRILDADRQFEEDEPELVAELVGLLQPSAG